MAEESIVLLVRVRLDHRSFDLPSDFAMYSDRGTMIDFRADLHDRAIADIGRAHDDGVRHHRDVAADDDRPIRCVEDGPCFYHWMLPDDDMLLVDKVDPLHSCPGGNRRAPHSAKVVLNP